MGPTNEQLRKLRLKGSPPLSLLRCLSGQYFESGILFIYSGQLGTREERNKGCGGKPFNLNFLNCSFVGPISSYLGYRSLITNHEGLGRKQRCLRRLSGREKGFND